MSGCLNTWSFRSKVKPKITQEKQQMHTSAIISWVFLLCGIVVLVGCLTSGCLRLDSLALLCPIGAELQPNFVRAEGSNESQETCRQSRATRAGGSGAEGSCPTYVSMTTLPERLRSDYFRTVVDTILLQPVDKLVLNIPMVCHRTREEYVVPDWVDAHDKILVNRCEDLGPVTKVLGSAGMIPKGAIVVVVDDDIIYKDFMVQGLVSSVQEDEVRCWNTWRDDSWGVDFCFPGGYSGCAMTEAVHRQLCEFAEPVEECFSSDDHWLGWVYNQRNISLQSVNDSLAWNHSLSSLYDHPKWFELRLDRSKLVQEHLCRNRLRV